MPYPKFSGIDFSQHDVIEFNPTQTDVGVGFRCDLMPLIQHISKIENS